MSETSMGELVFLAGLLFWVISVELRLYAAKLLGEIVRDDFEERGLVERRERSEREALRTEEKR